jgi:TetR/AcrR family transcriptional regulator, upper aerobic nicotinate degradation pathway regulator
MSKSSTPQSPVKDKKRTTRRTSDGSEKAQGSGRALGRPSAGTRGAIISAAILEFSEEGFGGARIERISKRANTSDRMLYYHFDSKDALFQAALEKVHEDMVLAESKIELQQVDPREGMKRLIAFLWRYFQENPQFISMVNIENMNAARHAKNSKLIQSHARPALRLVEEVLERGVAAGYFRRDVTLFEMHLTIVSLCYYYLSNAATMSNFHDYDMMRPEARDTWLTHITRVVMDFLTVRELR